MDTLPKTRELAREAGEKYYFTGEPCKHGHITKRAVVSGSCCECTKLATKKWMEGQPNKAAEYTAAYRKRNPELSRERGRINRAAYVARHKEVVDTKKAEKYREKVAAEEGRTVRDSNRMSEEEFLGIITGLENTVEYISGYTTMLARANFRCKEHDKEFSAIANNVRHGANPCTSCNHATSGMEQEIADFLSEYVEIVQHDRTTLKPMEIDITIPSKAIGIEFNGLYWHSDEYKNKNYHRVKWQEAQNKGIQLVQIFEDEWRDKQELVKQRLKALIGMTEKYDARKTKVDEIQQYEAREFLRSTHLQGPGNAQKYYGLMQDEMLLAVASFGKARTGAMTSGSVESWEVIRYASIGRVRGGFSKLLRRFINDVNPVEIVSYCDLRYGDGRVYEVSGFTLVGITDPDYWWVPRGSQKRIPRYETQKHKLATHKDLGKYYSSEKTEVQVCQEAGWTKIHGVGHQKWLWTKS